MYEILLYDFANTENGTRKKRFQIQPQTHNRAQSHALDKAFKCQTKDVIEAFTRRQGIKFALNQNVQVWPYSYNSKVTGFNR